MEEKTNGNDPAFSKSAFYHPDGTFDLPENGLTKREFFAIMILQGLIAKGIPFAENNAVLRADDLIKELNK